MARVSSFRSIIIYSSRPLSVTIKVDVKDEDEVIQFIQKGNFPNRLRLALYITNFPGKTDCINLKALRGLHCKKGDIYPLNRLRNIAIQNSLTSHFVVFDMDMWPASKTYKIDQSISFLFSFHASS